MPIIRQICQREPPGDPTLWHKWSVFWPVRLEGGGVSFNRVWRKRTADGRWIYKERPETEAEWIDRQW